MPVDPEEVKARLEALRKDFVAELPSRLESLEAAWKRLQRGPWVAAAFQEFHRGVHALAGSGAMFRCDRLSARARSLDQVLKPFGSGETPPDAKTAGLISDGLAAMKEAGTS